MQESSKNTASWPDVGAVIERAELCPPRPNPVEPGRASLGQDHGPRLWYAVHTRSRHEEVVHRLLVGKAIETFLPKMEVWSRRVDRRKRIQVPLFRGYLFVNVAMDRQVCSEIVRTRGVVRVLGNSGGCIPVPESQIESVRTLLAAETQFRPHPYLEVGRRVRVVAGPLAGCYGILLKVSDKRGRLAVAVDIIRQAVSVEIDSLDVEPA